MPKKAESKTTRTGPTARAGRTKQITKTTRRRKKISSSDLLPESREFIKPRKTAALSRGGPRKMDTPSRGGAAKINDLSSDEAGREEIAFNFNGQKQKENAQKRMIMWSGVSFFMVLIAVVWIFNTKQVFTETAKISETAEGQELSNAFGELNSAIQDIKSELDKLNSLEIEQGGENGLPEGEMENNMESDLPESEAEYNLPANGSADKIEELKNKLEGQKLEI